MIRTNSTIVGTISKSASFRNDKEGEPHVSFRVKVIIPSSEGKAKEISIFVNKSNAANDDLQNLLEGKRVQVNGTMDIRPDKKEQENAHPDPLFYMNAEGVKLTEVPDLDSITGTMDFIGKVAKNIEVKKGAHSDFLVFSAYSSERDQQSGNWFSTFVRFMKFPAKGEAADSLRPDWLNEKVKISVNGDIQISSYEGRISITSRVNTMEEYKAQNN